jgi:hypothetical protein
MKSSILTAILLFSTPIFAQTVLNKQVVCMESAALIKALSSDEIQEKIFWAAKSDDNDSKFALFVNSKTKKWTLVQLNEKIGCIVGTGDHSTLVQDFQSIKK